jgi:hypothetical protein
MVLTNSVSEPRRETLRHRISRDDVRNGVATCWLSLIALLHRGPKPTRSPRGQHARERVADHQILLLLQPHADLVYDRLRHSRSATHPWLGNRHTHKTS